MLITIEEAAKRMSVSRQTVYRLMQANAYRHRILTGEITESDVPKDTRRYLFQSFPEGVRVGERTIRLDADALEKWMQRCSAY